MCKQDFKSKPWFLKHQAAHKLKGMCIFGLIVFFLISTLSLFNSPWYYFVDALNRMPNSTQFKQDYSEKLMNDIIEEILKEPSYQNSKNALFLRECGKSDKWPEFVNLLTSDMSVFLFEKQTKILPMNQYEETQKKVNSYLNLNIDKLKEILLSCSDVDISESQASRLVFRIAIKFFQGATQWIVHTMRNKTQDQDSSSPQEFNETDEKLFLLEISGFLRDCYEAFLKNPQHLRKCDCIKAVFINGQHLITRSQILKKSNWYSGEEDCLVLSEHASNFFKILELEVMPACVDQSSSNEVIENSLLHRALLNSWYYLTNQFFSEELSITFLREIVTLYVKFSLNFEEKRLNRLQEKSVRASTVALRNHLQRNYVEKETDDNVEKVT